jgi:hypothetical protein
MNYNSIDSQDQEVDIMEITDDRTHSIIVFTFSAIITLTAMSIDDLSLILGF